MSKIKHGNWNALQGSQVWEREQAVMTSRIDRIFETAKQVFRVLASSDLSAEGRQAVINIVIATKNEGMK